MPTTRHRFSKCSHRGLGAQCARCQTAERLEAMAEIPKNKRKEGLYQDWDKEQLLAEAKRLRGPQKKKGQRAPVADTSQE